jgi:lipopolysaccharide export system protein LptA
MPRPGNPAWQFSAAALLLALSAGAVPAAGAAAQPPAAGLAAGGNGRPVKIRADSGIEWRQDQHLYIARGNAVAIRGDSEVHADTLIAHYRPVKGGGNAGGNTEIYRVDAEGNVVLTRSQDTVVGDRAVYDVDRAIAVVTGKGLKLTTPSDVVTARDSLEWYDQKQIAVARGDAVAIQNGRTIKADVLTAYMVKTAPGGGKAVPGVRPATARRQAAGPGPPGEGESKISRVDAQGHVVVSKAGVNGGPGDVGRGDFGVYDARTGIATLIGHVVIARGKDVVRGQRGIMDLDHNVSRILPGGTHHRVEGLFVRQDLGKPGAAAPGGGAAAGGKAR